MSWPVPIRDWVTLTQRRSKPFLLFDSDPLFPGGADGIKQQLAAAAVAAPRRSAAIDRILDVFPSRPMHTVCAVGLCHACGLDPDIRLRKFHRPEEEPFSADPARSA